jgi:hypothetical protein
LRLIEQAKRLYQGESHLKVDIKNMKMHDVNVLDLISTTTDSFYILDIDYLYYTRLYRIHRAKAFFINKTKKNLHFSRIYSSKTDKSNGVLLDQTIKLKGYYVSKEYPEKLRWIKYIDPEKNKTLIF